MKLFGLEIKKSMSSPPPKSTRVSTRFKSILPRWLRSDYTLRNNELIFAAASRLSNSLSSMPIGLKKGSAPVKNHYLNDMISLIPNPNMSSTQFFKTLEACRCTEGNAYALKRVNEYEVVERIDVLDPSRVTPQMDMDSGELWYVIQPEMGQPYYIHNYYILHIPFISTNGYVGINPVNVLFDTLSYAGAIKEFSVSQIKKGVNASIVLEAPANLQPDQKQSLINDLHETYAATGGNIILLESGVTAKTLNLSPIDTKIFEVEKITRGKVAMVYGIPPHMLGDYANESYSSQEQKTLEFLTMTMLPIVVAYEQELTRKLLSPEERRNGYEFKFKMDAILRADALTTANVNQRALRGGWRTINEIRKEEGRSKITGGDIPLTSRDLTSLDAILAAAKRIESGEENGNSQIPPIV